MGHQLYRLYVCQTYSISCIDCMACRSKEPGTEGRDCVGGVLSRRRCDCGSQTGGICSVAAIEGAEEICCWGCGFESKSSWIPQLCLPSPACLVLLFSTRLKKLHFIDCISCEARLSKTRRDQNLTLIEEPFVFLEHYLTEKVFHAA